MAGTALSDDPGNGRLCDCHRCARERESPREWFYGTVVAIVVGVAAAVIWAFLL